MKLLLLFLFVGSITYAQTPLHYLSSTDGGSAYEILYSDNLLYIGAANTLEIYDLTGNNRTPNNLLFKHRFLSNIDQLTIKDGYLYICANHDGLWKYDLSANPAQPTPVAHYTPNDIGTSIYDIAFYGDTIFVAAKTEVQMLLDAPASLTYLGTVAAFAGSTRVRGIDVKNGYMAYTVGFSANNAQDGIYLHSTTTMQQLAFYNSTQGDPLEVYFGQNNDLLHVMGGQVGFNGLYYVLEYIAPNTLALKFSQTIDGQILLGSIAAPMSACIVNDTVYVTTQGGGPINYVFGQPYTGQVYVFDATNPNDIQLLTDIYAGLYHFDIDIDAGTRKMYIASEWYGVLTVDITNIYNEIDLGKTRTGGWCHGSAFAKNRLVEASEGYGLRLWNTDNMQSPQLIAEDTTVGFCRAISISDSADYVYGWFLTGNQLRVFDGNDLSPLANTSTTIALPTDYRKSRMLGDKIAVIVEELANKRIILANVSQPTNPVQQAIRAKNNVEDLLFHAAGHLLICANDSLLALDTINLSRLGGINAPAGRQFEAFTMDEDTLYAYCRGTNAGIAKYSYNALSAEFTLINISNYMLDIPANGHVFMACDDSLLYIASSVDSLVALQKQIPYQRQAVYNHGADFIYDNLWGVTELYHKNGYLFLNEYMGQTSIFGQAMQSPIITTLLAAQTLTLYPNPCTHFCRIELPAFPNALLRIVDTRGRLFYSTEVTGTSIDIDVSDFKTGVYVVHLQANGQTWVAKMVVTKK